MHDVQAGLFSSCEYSEVLRRCDGERDNRLFCPPRQRGRQEELWDTNEADRRKERMACATVGGWGCGRGWVRGVRGGWAERAGCRGDPFNDVLLPREQRTWEDQLEPVTVVVCVSWRHQDRLKEELAAVDGLTLRSWGYCGCEEVGYSVGTTAEAHGTVNVAVAVHAEDLDAEEGVGGLSGYPDCQGI